MPRCCVHSCFIQFQSLHRFPIPAKNKLLFDKWVSLCGNRHLIVGTTPENVYKSYRVCSVHFLPEDFGANNRLKKEAVPSVNLPDPVQYPSEGEQPATSSVTDPSTSDTADEIELQEVLPVLPHDPISAKIQEIDPAIPGTSWQFPTVKCDLDVSDGENKDNSNISHQSNIPTPVTTPKVHKRRSTLLSEVNVGQIKDLTPKARRLYTRVVQLKRQLAKLKKGALLTRRRLRLAEKFTSPEILEKVVSSMDRIKARFFQGQLENEEKKPRGRRYTLEDKVLALALYKQSGSGYRFLAKIFSMPSRKTIMALLNRIPIRPGLHTEVFTILKAEVKNFKNPLDKHCILMFDEINIKPHLQPNLKDGTVEGFEDLGFRRSEQIANHSQVFMLRGIRRKWKQPVYYNFVNGGTKSTDLVYIIKLIVRRCQSIGINILATVSDQGANNQAAINTLVRSTQETYKRSGRELYDYCFEIDGHKIIPLFDVPHLFKGLRNNFLKYNLCFLGDDGTKKIAKWSHIFTSYQLDPYLGSLRLMPKLTDSHVNPEKVNKMKVSKCTQVFSHSVAAAINVFAFSGLSVESEGKVIQLEPAASDTATLLDFLDLLFDSLNGSSFNPQPGKLLRIAVTPGSPHLQHWKDAITKLNTFSFIKENGSNFTPPSLKNLIKTIKNFINLWSTMSQIGFSCLMPRTFNQDPLENFFGRIRQRGQRNVNPTPTDFGHYYKSLLVNQFTSAQSVGTNCEDDHSDVFLTLQRLVSQGLPEEDKVPDETYCEVPKQLPSSLAPIEARALRYVAGFVFKKIGRQPCDCKKFFLKRDEDIDDDDEDFLRFKEYKRTKLHLKYVNVAFLNKLKTSLAIIKYIFNRNLYKIGILKYTLNVLCKTITFTDCFHDETIKLHIFKYFIKINIFNYSKQLNRILTGLDQRNIPKTAPKIFLNAKHLHCTTLKRKKTQSAHMLIV